MIAAAGAAILSGRCYRQPVEMPVITPLPLERAAEPFDHPEWSFEAKYDGFRALAYVSRGRVKLISRNGIV